MLGAETMTIQLSDSEKLSNSLERLLSRIYPEIRNKPYSLYTVYFDSELVSSSDEAQEQINSWLEEIYPNEDCIVHTVQNENGIYSRVFRFKESEELLCREESI